MAVSDMVFIRAVPEEVKKKPLRLGRLSGRGSAGGRISDHAGRKGEGNLFSGGGYEPGHKRCREDHRRHRRNSNTPL